MRGLRPSSLPKSAATGCLKGWISSRRLIWRGLSACLSSPVAAWARWSFSLGLLAVLAATWTVLRRRGGYNPVEHLVLAAYVQFVVIAANVLNLLPLLVLDASRWAAPWRQAASWYMTPLELAVVAVACKQFFHLRWRGDGWRIAMLLAVFFLCKKALLLAYGRLVYHVALAQ